MRVISTLTELVRRFDAWIEQRPSMNALLIGLGVGIGMFLGALGGDGSVTSAGYQAVLSAALGTVVVLAVQLFRGEFYEESV